MYLFPLSSLFFYLSRSPSLKETGRALSLSFSFVQREGVFSSFLKERSLSHEKSKTKRAIISLPFLSKRERALYCQKKNKDIVTIQNAMRASQAAKLLQTGIEIRMMLGTLGAASSKNAQLSQTNVQIRRMRCALATTASQNAKLLQVGSEIRMMLRPFAAKSHKFGICDPKVCVSPIAKRTFQKTAVLKRRYLQCFSCL